MSIYGPELRKKPRRDPGFYPPQAPGNSHCAPTPQDGSRPGQNSSHASVALTRESSLPRRERALLGVLEGDRAKDMPILLAAIASGATHLITSDLQWPRALEIEAAIAR
jgi:hypothetical protein